MAVLEMVHELVRQDAVAPRVLAVEMNLVPEGVEMACGAITVQQTGRIRPLDIDCVDGIDPRDFGQHLAGPRGHGEHVGATAAEIVAGVNVECACVEERAGEVADQLLRVPRVGGLERGVLDDDPPVIRLHGEVDVGVVVLAPRRVPVAPEIDVTVLIGDSPADLVVVVVVEVPGRNPEPLHRLDDAVRPGDDELAADPQVPAVAQHGVARENDTVFDTRR